eukprot:g32797.t1
MFHLDECLEYLVHPILHCAAHIQERLLRLANPGYLVRIECRTNRNLSKITNLNGKLFDQTCAEPANGITRHPPFRINLQNLRVFSAFIVLLIIALEISLADMAGPEPAKEEEAEEEQGLTGVPRLLAGAAAGYVSGLVAVIVPDILIWVAGGAVFAAHWDTSKTVSSSSSDVMNVYHERPILPMT